MVSPEMSSQELKWWYDNRYAIYDLNVNSVAVYPQHEEQLDLAAAAPIYTVKGYAYAGGGRRVTRAEVSLDKGKCITTSPDKNFSGRNLTDVLLQPGALQKSNTSKTNTATSKAICSAVKSTCGGENHLSAGPSGPSTSPSPIWRAVTQSWSEPWTRH